MSHLGSGMSGRAPRATNQDEDAQDGLARSGAIFLRGLSIGALIGAAIAGSAIWERRRTRRPGGGATSPSTGTGVDHPAEPEPRT
jgi:hypothetical protein